MTTELEKEFFDTFGIECNIHFHQQFNGAQVPRGLEFYKEREKLEKEGIIKIWHKMLNPRPENDCIYWGEYHYPQITDRHYLELICVLNKYFASAYQCCSMFASQNIEEVKNDILKELLEIIEQHRQLDEEDLEDLDDIKTLNKLKRQAQAIFKEER